MEGQHVLASSSRCFRSAVDFWVRVSPALSLCTPAPPSRIIIMRHVAHFDVELTLSQLKSALLPTRVRFSMHSHELELNFTCTSSRAQPMQAQQI